MHQLFLDISSLHLLVWGSGNKVDRSEVCIQMQCIIFPRSISVSQPFRNKVGEAVTNKLFCLLHYYLKYVLAEDSKFSVIFWNTQTYAFQIITASGGVSICRYQYNWNKSCDIYKMSNISLFNHHMKCITGWPTDISLPNLRIITLNSQFSLISGILIKAAQSDLIFL